MEIKNNKERVICVILEIITNIFYGYIYTSKIYKNVSINFLKNLKEEFKTISNKLNYEVEFN
jgi:uncharacterized ion transporter superfamily protein YfcC